MTAPINDRLGKCNQRLDALKVQLLEPIVRIPDERQRALLVETDRQRRELCALAPMQK